MNFYWLSLFFQRMMMNKKSRELLIKSFDNINNWDCDKYTL